MYSVLVHTVCIHTVSPLCRLFEVLQKCKYWAPSSMILLVCCLPYLIRQRWSHWPLLGHPIFSFVPFLCPTLLFHFPLESVALLISELHVCHCLFNVGFLLVLMGNCRHKKLCLVIVSWWCVTSYSIDSCLLSLHNTTSMHVCFQGRSGSDYWKVVHFLKRLK